MIPKIIHYCWFGPNPIPENEISYINGWKVKMPEYKIMFWNEETFDISKSVEYVRQAYESKKYAFVSDYVRMFVLYKYGGIYLDTDVEIIKSLDSFTKNKFFIGFENKTMLGTCVIGSEPEMWILKEMMEYYSRHTFLIANGLTNTTTNVQILVSILSKYGFIKRNQEQKVNNIHIYERDFFVPKKISETDFLVTNRSVTIHHMDGSWLTEREKNRGTNKIWRNICRPILKNIRSVLEMVIGEEQSKKIEVKFRHFIK